MSPGRDPVIDLRSDACATPTDEMWDAMRAADVGWAYVGEDRSVNALEALAAETLGKEQALFVPTCSMANLLALMSLGERGTQVVVEATAHIVASEAWGLAYVCGLYPHTVEGIHGRLDEQAVECAIAAARSAGQPRTSLVCLENSHTRAGGTVLDEHQTAAVAGVARRYHTAVYLDGARLFNAAAALGVPAARLAEAADAVAISLNKGLCAPFGAVLAGSRAIIEEARLNLKRIGGASVHKAGIAAAAGIIALAKMVDRLDDDNRRAAALAAGLSEVPGLNLDPQVQTNIVLVGLEGLGCPAEAFLERLAARGVLGMARSHHLIRFVTHRLVGDREVRRTVSAVAAAADDVSNETGKKGSS